mgnify:CR=1 FL=1
MAAGAVAAFESGRVCSEQRLSPALWAVELLSLCVPKEKVAKEKRHPDGAPSGHPALRVRGRVTGFFDSTSCAGEKLAGIPAGHPADFPPPARRAIGAPGKAARSRRAEARAQRSAANSRRFAFAVAFAVASGAHDARLLFGGPSATVRRGRQGRIAGVAMEGNAFSRGQDARSKSPAPPHGLAGQDARQASPRGGLLFGLLFSWPRKRKVTRAASAARNRFETCEEPAARANRPHSRRVATAPQGGEGNPPPNRRASC